MHPSYYYKAHACILVFDVTRKVTYQNLANWCGDLKLKTAPSLARTRSRSQVPRAADVLRVHPVPLRREQNRRRREGHDEGVRLPDQARPPLLLRVCRRRHKRRAALPGGHPRGRRVQARREGLCRRGPRAARGRQPRVCWLSDHRGRGWRTTRGVSVVKRGRRCQVVGAVFDLCNRPEETVGRERALARRGFRRHHRHSHRRPDRPGVLWAPAAHDSRQQRHLQGCSRVRWRRQRRRRPRR